MADMDVVVGKTRQTKEIKKTKEHSISSTAAKTKSKEAASFGGGGGKTSLLLTGLLLRYAFEFRCPTRPCLASLPPSMCPRQEQTRQ
jgi:hypothetical protein